LKLGWVTASLLAGKLQASRRQNALTRALQEYGRLVKTIFILRYLESEEYRRRITTQLNKGESMHALRRFLVFANDGQLRRRQPQPLQPDRALRRLLSSCYGNPRSARAPSMTTSPTTSTAGTPRSRARATNRRPPPSLPHFFPLSYTGPAR